MGVEITLSDRVACGYPDGNHFDWLAVEPQQVVLGQTEAADGCFGF